MLNFLKQAFTGNFNLKAFSGGKIIHPAGSPSFVLNLPRTKINYAKDVGTGLGSSSIMAPVQWIQRAFPEAPLVVNRKTKQGFEAVEEHPLTELIDNPNPHYSGIALWWASIFSWVTTGNVYWLIERNELTGRPIALWWAAPWLISPVFPRDGSEFITGYEYRAAGKKEKLDLEDVFHVKHGIDPNNPRLGISPIYSAIREVWTDDEASNFVASLLRNSGVPGLIVSPDSNEGVDPEDIDATKEYFKRMFTGDRRGEPIVMTGKTKVHEFGFSPDKMDLSNIRDVTEERVCANLGIPAAIVGFGSGLQQTKVGATMKELRQLAWINGILPIQNIFAKEIQRSLLPMFESNPSQFRVIFDITQVTALDDDMDKKYARGNIGVAGGFMEVAEARELVGLDVRDGDHIYLRPSSSFETPAPLKQTTMLLGVPQKGSGLKVVENSNGVLIYHPESYKEPTVAEERAIENAPRRRPPRSHQTLIRSLERLERSQIEPFAKALTKIFDDLGRIVADVAEENLKGANIEKKELAEADILLAQADSEAIAALVVFGPTREAMREAYSKQYEQIARSTFAESNTALGLSVNLPDPAALRIIETGGRRVGLIDLEKQVRGRLFTTIAEAREQGLGADAIARLIRNDIPKGPWSSVQIRARIIARTETKFAQNQSMIEFAKASGARSAMIFDARLGETDEECEALNGVIVTLEEAESLVADEHVNGTRSLTPWYEDIEEATG